MGLTFERHDPSPRCAAWRAESGKVRCELPLGHLAMERHLGRDRAGRFHQWYGDARPLSQEAADE